DALAIASETAKTLGMGTDILDAASLGDTKRTETADMAKAVEDADGYAQVFPEHKFHIVDVLQRRGHIVGMTGDGVNDAPALKKADCGIAVSSATDAARSAASIVLTTPGLSVIIDAIKESRKIFQRMNSYAIYRIAETLRVLLFISLVILIFNFFPVTAMQIVLLALLNDGAILSIAYDNVRYRNQPEAWNMRVVLGMASILGVVGPIAAFGMFYLGDRVFHLGHPELQTMMYLTLSVAGHLTIFQARTRGPFWSIRPARILLLAVIGTQALATCIAVFGIFMTPLGWRYAALVWGYALVWFVATDQVKLLGYRMLDPSGTAAREHQAASGFPSPADVAAIASSVTPFHTDVNTSPAERVYHDSSACPYGKEITRDGHDIAGSDRRRRCEWCEAHAGVVPFHTDVNTSRADRVYHDLAACPYGQEISRDGHAKTGSDGRRRCEWCEAHAGVNDSPDPPLKARAT
ncbi:MAG: HAD-IC family P-type ATPase, partial [Acidobacteria bacterium]|nr:HAD-IC family P-type ATPase [Acidobacteriota bacterium]